MKKLEIYTATAPSYWASYFINGDPSGLEMDERERADKFIERMGWGWPCSCSAEPWFSRYSDALNESPLAGDVLEYTWLI